MSDVIFTVCNPARNVIGHIASHFVEVWRKVVYMKDGLPCKRISLLLSLRLPRMGELLVIRFLLDVINS